MVCHQKIIDLYRFGQLYIDKPITNAKLQKFQQIDQRKISKSIILNLYNPKTGWTLEQGRALGHLP